MDWERLAPDFAWDGSLRDIVVRGSAGKWQRVIDWVRRLEPRPFFVLDGAQIPLPETLAEVRAIQVTGLPTLQINVSGLAIHCHFFPDGDIEFDIDPREVNADRLAPLTDFMAALAEQTGCEVVLTYEGIPAAVIIRCAPGETPEAP